MTAPTDTDTQEIKAILINFGKRFDELDKKIEVQGVKLEAINQRIDSLEKTIDQRFEQVDQRFISFEKTVDQRFASIETQLVRQDNRFWSFVSISFVALLSILAKVAFFPPGSIH